MSEPAAPISVIERRSERISVRVTTEEGRLIERAAALEGRTLTSFLVPQMIKCARRIVESHEKAPRGGFEVLCRIDAFADYVAEVDAEDAEAAAQRARDNHGDYRWEDRSTQEFDARLYVTLDVDGDEIEETQVGDF